MKRVFAISALILSLLLCACNHQQQRQAEAGDTLHLKYAENISIVSYPAYKVVTMKNPWKKGQPLHTYILVEREDSARCGMLPEGTVIYTPLKSAVSFNTAHAYLIGELGAIGQLKGVADLKYMLLPEIHRRVADGRIKDCGDSMLPNVERIIMLRADAILLSPFENSGGYGRLEEIGIPIIECADYMETSALGRAEWMKFYGLLFGKEQEADSLFNVVDEEYQSMRRIYGSDGSDGSVEAREQGNRKPQMLTEKLTGSTWYVPGGKSSVAQLIADAGGSYAWMNDSHSGSLALPFETVLAKAGKSDVWIFNDYGNEAMTYNRLLAEYHGYAIFEAFKKRRVWYVNSLKVPYFEEVSFRPDRLLRDYIILLHPECNFGEPRYYKKVE